MKCHQSPIFTEMVDDLVSEPDLNKRIEKGREMRRRVVVRIILNREKEEPNVGTQQGVGV